MKRIIILLLFAGLLGGAIVQRINQKRAADVAQRQQQAARAHSAPPVGVVPAAVRDVVSVFQTVGSVEAPFNIKIAPKVTGRIIYLTVHEGDHVSKGQVLVQIDPSEIEAEVRQHAADLDAARNRLTQAQLTENPTNVSVTTQIRVQQATVASAHADYVQVKGNYASQVAVANAAVTDAQGRIDAADAAVANGRAAIQSAQANLDNATTKYNRVYDLYKQAFAAAQDVDDARTTVSVEKGALDVARGQLNAADAQRSSAVAQKQSAQQNADIVTAKGKDDIEAAREKYLQAIAALDFAKSNRAQRPAYRANLAALQAAVDSAQQALQSTEAQRADTTLASPIDGFVTSRMMDPGAMATPGAPIVAIQEIRQVWVTFAVPEEVSRKIHVGQPAQASFDALPGRTFSSRVTQVNPSADPTGRQFTVRLTLGNPGGLLKPGMFAHVTIVTDRTSGRVVVPLEAVHHGPGGSVVDVVDDKSIAHVRPVTLGPSDAQGTAVLDGLQPGEKVVVMSTSPLKEGQAVRLGARRSPKSDGAPHSPSTHGTGTPGPRKPA